MWRLCSSRWETIILFTRRFPSWLLKDLESRFREYLSVAPWLAVPFSDSEARLILERRFLGHARYCPIAVALDPSGMVLNLGIEAEAFIRKYGAEGFPFNPDRKHHVKLQDDISREKPSLLQLLSYGDRDYVITNEGQKVPIADLQHKVVGL